MISLKQGRSYIPSPNSVLEGGGEEEGKPGYLSYISCAMGLLMVLYFGITPGSVQDQMGCQESNQETPCATQMQHMCNTCTIHYTQCVYTCIYIYIV